ncbi:MAG: hypothetical protein Q7T82_07000 [Armatimonadota bacterium]|nr:hypothetical protein [Armatimonadota bacterium]
MPSWMTRADKTPLLTWREPPEATALRAAANLTFGPFGHGPMFYEDESGRRLNWAAVAGVLSWIVFELKPWKFRKLGAEKIALILGAAILAFLILRRIRIPQRLKKALTKNVFGKQKPPKKSAVISIFHRGIKLDNILLPWRDIARYRIDSHPEKPDLRVIELRGRSSPASESAIFVGFYPDEVEEGRLLNLLFDLHPIGYWGNVGAT